MQACSDKYEFCVRWEPFLLRPNIPVQGIQKAPATPENPRVNPRLKAAGSQVGIDFTGKCDIYPNTLQAHAFLEYAKSLPDESKQNILAEALFQAYFTDGDAPTEPNLLNIADKLGFNRGEVQAVITDDKKVEEAKQKALSWSLKGVSGVPYFYINGQKAFSGAQDSEAFLRLFDVIAEKFPLPSQGSGASGSG